MVTSLLVFLILFPLAVAAILMFVRQERVFPVIVYPAAAILIAGSCLLLKVHAGGALALVHLNAPWAGTLMFWLELGIAAWLLFLTIKQKDTFVSALVIIQSILLVWFHFGPGHHVQEGAPLFIDLFAVILGLIIGIIGTLIAVFAVDYMKDMHHHAPYLSDKRTVFFGTIFLFLSAMFGVCFSNDLSWMFFFWEITTVCSFLMIRYKKDVVSVRNAFWALRWNLLGGIGFLAGLCALASCQQTLSLDKLLAAPKAAVLLPVALISFAGLTKSAQLPFSSWLVGAMVAPTPVSALLHSSTMVKAGVYIVLRFATTLEGTMLGTLIAFIGLITFLFGSFICISQSDAKKVLAYSTIANLGLVILCAGIGSYEAVWAGILLIVFHAVSKGLLFLCVGSIQHKIMSRSIEDMPGLVIRLPRLALMLEIGIAGMFLAPFGMLISKWAVLRAIVDFNPFFAVFLIYGSAATLFFWVKWLGKIIIVEKGYENIEKGISAGQMIPMGILAVMTVGICAFFSPFAHAFIEPYIMALYNKVMTLGAGNMTIMLIMLGLVGLFPLAFLKQTKGLKEKDPYLGGANTVQDGQKFIDSLGAPHAMGMKNFYMADIFSEEGLMRLGVIITSAFLAGMIIVGGMSCLG